MFGQIAVANALSDVYAKGGIPLTALNIVCFPIKKMDVKILQDILRGGTDKLREAKVTLLGGHSVEDDELKYGLSVTGVIHPQHIIRNKGAQPGDSIILTKPIGTGIINTAIKANFVDNNTIELVQNSMAMLNMQASQIMIQYPITSGTDITGFGLLGHLGELLYNSKVGCRLFSKDIPIFPRVLEFAEIGLIPAGAYRNRKFKEHQVNASSNVSLAIMDALYDPQTSGGLLFTVEKNQAKDMIEKLRQKELSSATIIGEIVDEKDSLIFVE